ncbi:MAG: hypothetical protein D6788_03870 [Planctomycetota bacterium]|nr:MAG: hypothetical protein D6788_03870 [Planctomycetota bacterium]
MLVAGNSGIARMPTSARATTRRSPGGSRMKNTVLLAMSVTLLCGCASRSWNGGVRMWGTLRGVLRDGDTSGKVRLSDAIKPHGMGIGAPEGLAGEIVVLDGETWVARADARDRVVTHHPAPPDTSATFLAIATVPRWVDARTEGGLTLDGLAKKVRALAKKSGIDRKKPFPFVVKGRFSTVRLHILNGRCPFAAPRPGDAAARDPVRVQADRVRGMLVGFYDEGPPGILTHAGKRLHVHAILQDEHHTVGHVEAVSVEPGATIRLPAIR